MAVISAGRSLLERLATRHGLDGLMEIVALQEAGEPPESDAQRAFALLTFGLPIYREMGHAQYFPATSRRARRIGSRGVRGSLASAHGERAVIFMTHAVPLFSIAFWECQAQKGAIDDPGYYAEYHGAILSLLHFPLDAEDERALNAARREVDVFRTRLPIHEPVLAGPATGYGRALREGRDPDSDPGLVESHVGYALHIFRITTQNHAIRLGLSATGYAAIESDMLTSWMTSPEGLVWRASIDAYWTEVVGEYFDSCALAT